MAKKQLTLMSKESVREAVRRRGAEIAAAMTDSEFFLSDAFKKYATQLTDFILKQHKLYSLSILYDENDDSLTAYTDGKKIVVNAGNGQVKNAKLLERRFKVVMGMIFHEASHKLFLDFSVMNRAFTKIQGGVLYGKFPTEGNPDLEKAKAELEKVTASPYSSAICSIYQMLNNYIADGHDELCMKRIFKGFIQECIIVKNEEQVALTPSLNEFISKRADKFTIYAALILEYAKYGFYVIAENTSETQEYVDFMSALEPTIDAALSCDDTKDRWDYLNLLMLQLWPCLREQFPEDPQGQPQSGQNGQGQNTQQGGNSSGSSSAAPQQGEDGTSSPEEVQKAIQNIAAEVEKALNNAPAPQNCKGKAVEPQNISAQMAPSSGTSAGQLANQIAHGKAVEAVQKELDKSQMEAIRGANIPLIHKNVDLNVNRHNSSDKAAYDLIAKDIEPVVRNMVKEMQALLRELNEEAVQHHKRIGPIVEASEAYRPDKAFFARKKLPADLPDMAICVLIDRSGSMHGEKLNCAIRTAILLERFASAINIPIMIAGHDVTNCVNLHIYTDYVSAMEAQDRYSLASITAGGCNRDGYPIRICCDRLAERPEKVRLMVVISDGAPNDTGYRGHEAREDIRKTIQEYRRKGLLIYGAAIDDDQEVIQSIYGKGFLSIQKLNLLPKTLVRLVRQQIT